MAKLADVKKVAVPANEPIGFQGAEQLTVSDDGELVPEKETIPKAAPAKAAPKKAGGAGQIKLAVASEVNEKINVCYYGPEGTGKTTNAAMLAKLGRVLYINAESGLIVKRLKRLGVPTENIAIWPDPDSGERVSYEGLDALFWQIKGELMDDPQSWAGVIWDSATEILNFVLEDVVAKQVVKAERAGKERDPFFTDIADYGTMTSQLRLLLRRYRDLPCHFAITALERRDTDDDGAVAYGPQVTPALMADIAGYVGVLIHTEVKEFEGEVVFSGRTAPGTKYRAKDRFGVLPRVMAVPTLDRVVGYVNDELTAETDPEQKAARDRAETARVAEEARKAAGTKKTTRAD